MMRGPDQQSGGGRQVRSSLALAGAKRRRDDGRVRKYDLLIDPEGGVLRVADVFRRTVRVLDESGTASVMDMAALAGMSVGEIPEEICLYEWLVWNHRPCWVSSLRRFAVGLHGDWYLDGNPTERLVPANLRAFWERGIHYRTREDEREWESLLLAREGLRFPSLRQRRKGFLSLPPAHWERPIPKDWNLSPLHEPAAALAADSLTDAPEPTRGERTHHERSTQR